MCIHMRIHIYMACACTLRLTCLGRLGRPSVRSPHHARAHAVQRHMLYTAHMCARGTWYMSCGLRHLNQQRRLWVTF